MSLYNNHLSTPKEKKELYSRLPEGFFKDLQIVPHNFFSPQNPDHGLFIDYQMKLDLFSETYAKIADIELPNLKKEQDFIKIKNITPCQDLKNESYFDQISTKLRAKEGDDMIRCENWTLNLNNEKEVDYKIKFYQSKTDRFYGLLFPPTIYKYAYFYYTNKSFI
ncbi:hypothetical protein PPERSA_10023 [Pseudocohnilembus persalinus]|uniref:Uncharacterized protein n=1 Tax=Pseudocohnilembus persalinus TaxID=266149 RepID=A0A0V0QJM8_PSEPJ|nr:hypothetical protein PPERSA_10023 [Pseudocohnilembus persalinus]|eukprot:KRX02406.1 hypothetical protein PPERSA_10023 [Pseudocohnilembus persalinus]